MASLGVARADRRTFLRTAAGFAIGTQLAPFAPWVVSAAQPDVTREVVAATASGKIRGRLVDGVSVFKGVSYGDSTAGANRFKAPRPPQSWTGVRDAFEYGPAAPQNEGMEDRSVREDCLVLNVWTPGPSPVGVGGAGLGDGGRRPVMVWLHGGGFTAGSGSSLVYDGTHLCRNGDVVVVSINHRLNVFGANFLADLAGEAFADSGCAGMLDIVAALQWVKENIASFGGDPGKVTIFGESGGGRKVSLLLAMPDAKGLFHRAIIQSGAILRVVPRDEGTRAAELLLAELGLDAARARELETLPVERILAAYGAVSRRFRLDERVVGLAPGTPVLDGVRIPQHPFDPVAPALSASVPVIVGYNRTEETVYYRTAPMTLDLDDAGLEQRVVERLGDRVPAPRVIEAYRRTHPAARPWDLWMLISTDHPRGTYPQTLAVRREKLAAAPTYVYRFDWDLGNALHSPHALEIPFVFDNVEREFRLFDVPKTPEAFALAKRMSAIWTAFARTGVPDTGETPRWPAYTAQSRHTMLFDNELRVVEDPSPETRRIMEEVLGLA
jgi:para-nitrobenzyl esterase